MPTIPDPDYFVSTQRRYRSPRTPVSSNLRRQAYWAGARRRVGISLYYRAKDTVANPQALVANMMVEGQYENRHYRQKPIVVLQKAEHNPVPRIRKKILNKIKQEAKPVTMPKSFYMYDVDFSKNNLSTTNRMPNPKSSTKATTSKKRTFKQATNSKNKKKVTKKPKSLAKVLKQEVTKLKKAINVDKAVHTFKQGECSTLKSLVGRCNHKSITGTDLSTLESACTNLRFYDPSAPGTLVTANQNTGTFARDVHFRDYRTKLVIRNNYQVPARVKVYLCKVKNDCNETPLTTYTTAIADQVISAGVDETDQLLYFTDIERVREVWNVDCVIDKLMEPGHEVSASHSTGPIDFDPSHVDSFTDAYQQVFKTHIWIIRVEGVLGHDTTVATEQTLLQAGVDYELYRKAVIEYDAGIALNDIYINETRAQSFTNAGVASLKPVSDNISYSVS